MFPGCFIRVSKLSLSPPISLTNPTVPSLIPIRTGTPGYHRHFWQNQNLQCERTISKICSPLLYFPEINNQKKHHSKFCFRF